MLHFNAKELSRLMKKMGISVEVEELKDVARILVERTDGSVTVVEDPQVVLMRLRGQVLLYVSGATIRTVERPQEVPAEAFTEEDVRLVAEEAGVTLEEARRALREAGGDLAKAVIMLQAGKGAAERRD